MGLFQNNAFRDTLEQIGTGLIGALSAINSRIPQAQEPTIRPYTRRGRMTERPNKRQRSLSYREDGSVDGKAATERYDTTPSLQASCT